MSPSPFNPFIPFGYGFYYGLALLESIPIGTVTFGTTSIQSTLPTHYNAAFTCERLARADAEIVRMTVMELLSRFYTACRRTSLAESYIRQAYSTYAQCDVVLKLKQLVKANPNIAFDRTLSPQQHHRSLLPYRAAASSSSSVPLRMRHLAMRRPPAPTGLSSAPASSLPSSPMPAREPKHSQLTPLPSLSPASISPSITPTPSYRWWW